MGDSPSTAGGRPMSTVNTSTNRPTPCTTIASNRPLKRQEELSTLTITQTLPRISSTRTATVTLHGSLPSVPPANTESGGISDKQLSAILGATIGTVISLLILCYCWVRRRRKRIRYSSSIDTISRDFPSPPSPISSRPDSPPDPKVPPVVPPPPHSGPPSGFGRSPRGGDTGSGFPQLGHGPRPRPPPGGPGNSERPPPPVFGRGPGVSAPIPKASAPKSRHQNVAEWASSVSGIPEPPVPEMRSAGQPPPPPQVFHRAPIVYVPMPPPPPMPTASMPTPKPSGKMLPSQNTASGSGTFGNRPGPPTWHKGVPSATIPAIKTSNPIYTPSYTTPDFPGISSQIGSQNNDAASQASKGKQAKSAKVPIKTARSVASSVYEPRGATLINEPTQPIILSPVPSHLSDMKRTASTKPTPSVKDVRVSSAPPTANTSRRVDRPPSVSSNASGRSRRSTTSVTPKGTKINIVSASPELRQPSTIPEEPDNEAASPTSPLRGSRPASRFGIVNEDDDDPEPPSSPKGNSPEEPETNPATEPQDQPPESPPHPGSVAPDQPPQEGIVHPPPEIITVSKSSSPEPRPEVDPPRNRRRRERRRNQERRPRRAPTPFNPLTAMLNPGRYLRENPEARRVILVEKETKSRDFPPK